MTGQLSQLGDISTRGYVLLSASGLAQFLIGRYALFRCVASIGANRATPVRSLSVPLSLLMAVFVLGERVSMINGIGIAIVILAPITMVNRQFHDGEISFAKLWDGYFFAFINAIAFGCSPILIREAIGGTGLGVLATFIAYLAAAVPLLLSLIWPNRIATLQNINRNAFTWFTLSGIAVYFAAMFRYLAFDYAPVTVVEPLMRTGAVWTVIFAFLINRRLEAFSIKVLGAIFLTIVGSIFVVL